MHGHLRGAAPPSWLCCDLITRMACYHTHAYSIYPPSVVPAAFRYLNVAFCCAAAVQLNEALGDVPCEAVQKDFSLRGEQDQVLRVAERVMGAMARQAR